MVRKIKVCGFDCLSYQWFRSAVIQRPDNQFLDFSYTFGACESIRWKLPWVVTECPHWRKGALGWVLLLF